MNVGGLSNRVGKVGTVGTCNECLIGHVQPVEPAPNRALPFANSDNEFAADVLDISNVGNVPHRERQQILAHEVGHARIELCQHCRQGFLMCGGDGREIENIPAAPVQDGGVFVCLESAYLWGALDSDRC
jgi:hypothetical protein